MYKIYRVENVYGDGPYTSGEDFTSMFMDHSISPNHPSAFYNGEPLELVKDAPQYYCGFLFLEDLFDWFKGYIQLLYSRGFKIVVYQYPDEPLCGKSQVAFKMSIAELLIEDTLFLNQPEQIATYR